MAKQSKPKKLTAEAVKKAIEKHTGSTRFGAYIIARLSTTGKIEARFLKTNNTWSDWTTTTEGHIEKQCQEHGIDDSMIVQQ
jgi:hypothetical protein